MRKNLSLLLTEITDVGGGLGWCWLFHFTQGASQPNPPYHPGL